MDSVHTHCILCHVSIKKNWLPIPMVLGCSQPMVLPSCTKRKVRSVFIYILWWYLIECKCVSYEVSLKEDDCSPSKQGLTGPALLPWSGVGLQWLLLYLIFLNWWSIYNTLTWSCSFCGSFFCFSLCFQRQPLHLTTDHIKRRLKDILSQKFSATISTLYQLVL